MQKIILFVIGILIGALFLVLAVHGVRNTHVTIVFNELEPFPRNLPVYYKGFKLGESTRVYPSKNFDQTNVELSLNLHGMKLPANVTAKIKTKNKRDYIELIHPAAPSLSNLKNHSTIEGKKGVSFSSFVDGQLESGGFDELTESLNVTVKSAGEMLDAMSGMFQIASDILNDIRPSIKESGDNLVIATRNLAQVSKELNESAGDGRLKKSFDNIELVTRNFELSSRNISTLTARTDKETVNYLNCLLKRTTILINNVNDIILGFKETLSKKFAGMRLIFGKPLE